MKAIKSALLAFLAATSMTQTAEACTRTLFVGSDGVAITGRSMDWMEDLHSDLWAFPQDMTRNGARGGRNLLPGPPNTAASSSQAIMRDQLTG